MIDLICHPFVCVLGFFHQLDDQNKGPDMASESSVSKPATHQALNGDYKGSGYHKRHLYPVFHKKHTAVLTPPSPSPTQPHNTPPSTWASGRAWRMASRNCWIKTAFLIKPLWSQEWFQAWTLRSLQRTAGWTCPVTSGMLTVVSTTMTSPSFQEGISPVTIKTQGNLLPALLLWIRIWLTFTQPPFRCLGVSVGDISFLLLSAVEKEREG